MEVIVHVELFCHIMMPDVFVAPSWCAFEPNNTPEEEAAERARFRDHATELHVDDSTTLRQVLNFAAEAFGIRLRNSPKTTVADAISSVEFYCAGDEAVADRPWRYINRLPVVDEEGRLWMVDFREATLAGLRRSGEADLIDGDVLRPYLRPTIPQGSPTTAQDWIVVIRGLEAAWAALRTVEPAGVPIGVLDLVFGGKLREFGQSLAGRNVGATDLKRLSARRGWDTDEAARRLGMTNEEAANVMRALFYEQDERGLWQGTERTPG